MHPSGIMKLFTFLGPLLLGLITLSTASPTSSTAANATSQKVDQPAELLNERGEIVRREVVFTSQYNCPDEPNCIIELPVCLTNLADPNMCTVTYTTYKTWGFAALELWDNKCNFLGGWDSQVPYSNLQQEPQGFSLGSWLPYTVNIQIKGNPVNAMAFDFWPMLWYGGSGVQFPLNEYGYPYLKWALRYEAEGYSGARLPFQCRQGPKLLAEKRDEVLHRSDVLHRGQEPAKLTEERRDEIVRRDDVHNEDFPCLSKPACVHPIAVCVANYGDSSMCTLTYITGVFGFALLRLYDHNCNELGRDHYVPYWMFQEQPQGFALGSSLPWTVDLQIQGDPSNPFGGNFNAYVWYAGFGMRQPMVDIQWVHWAISSNYNDGWKSIALPFQCR